MFALTSFPHCRLQIIYRMFLSLSLLGHAGIPTIPQVITEIIKVHSCMSMSRHASSCCFSDCPECHVDLRAQCSMLTCHLHPDAVCVVNDCSCEVWFIDAKTQERVECEQGMLLLLLLIYLFAMAIKIH